MHGQGWSGVLPISFRGDGAWCPRCVVIAAFVVLNVKKNQLTALVLKFFIE